MNKLIIHISDLIINKIKSDNNKIYIKKGFWIFRISD